MQEAANKQKRITLKTVHEMLDGMSVELAKDDICYWITDEWYSFESPMQKEIETAYQTALKKEDDMAMTGELFSRPFGNERPEVERQ